jgi:exosortase
VDKVSLTFPRPSVGPVPQPSSQAPNVLTGAGFSVLAVLCLGVLSAIYWPVLRDLAWQWWDDPNYSHGFVVPIFSAFLIWSRRHELKGLITTGHWAGLVVLLAGVAALVVGEVGSENFLTRSSLVVLLIGLLLFNLGWPVVRAMAFPLAFLFFMIPLPATVFYAITFPLQRLAAQNAAWALDALGVPVLMDGNILHLSRISLGVVEACSGIRSLISLLAVAVAWAYLTLPGVLSLVVLAAAAVPITILANAVRVVTTGLIGQWYGIEYAQGFFHSASGWVIFLVAFAGLAVVHVAIQWVRRLARKAAR